MGRALLLAAAPFMALADEGGVSFWISGSYAGFAAVPEPPGWYLSSQTIYYSADASGHTTLQRGDTLNLGLGTEFGVAFFTPTWVPDTRVLGGQPSVSLGFGGGWNHTAADVAVATAGPVAVVRASDTVTGGLDLFPQAQLAWSHGHHNGMVYIMGDVPTGAYAGNRLSNLGIGHAALDGGGGYTYFDADAGHEASTVLGVTVNGVNGTTHYRNGVDAHLDAEASQFITERWQAGVVGYLYRQLSADSGRGDSVGPFESRAAAAGAELGYAFSAGGRTWYANVRGYWEFAARYRVAGHVVYATLDMPLTGRGSLPR